MENVHTAWWQQAVIYHIYPRSFQDSDSDGTGDLNGIRSRLDHIRDLGVGAVWISPVFPSPMADFGYDISDYRSVDPLFGSMEDMETLIKELHERNIRLILDLVPNHTSEEHSWFVESRSSRDHPRRNWYLWKDPAPGGGPPNNWLSVFGGSAWEWDEASGQYYYHSFLKEQPDLNWRNPDVRNAMYDVMRFWLEKGVDGFRVDVLWHLIKDVHFRDNPANPAFEPSMPDYNRLLPVHSTDQPEVHAVVQEMRRLMDSFGDERVLIGEVYLPFRQLMLYYGEENNGAHLPFNFQLVTLPWDAPALSASIAEYEGLLPSGAWPNWVLGNHDNARIAGKVGIQQARVAAVLLFMLRGTPTVYYGDEIGMRDVGIPSRSFRDPQGLRAGTPRMSRDPARTPMQWDGSRYGGFSDVRPWLPCDPATGRINAARQERDPHSMLTLYRRLIRLRRKEPSLLIGRYTHVYSDAQVLAFTRRHEGAPAFLVVLNLTHLPAWFSPEGEGFSGRVMLSTIPELEGQIVQGEIVLEGDAGLVIRLGDSNG